MAHFAVHLALGLAVGTAALLPRVIRKAASGEKATGVVAGWLAVAWGLGAFAVVPSLLAKLGMPACMCQGWWMNIFVLHPLIAGAKSGGMLAGGAVILACFIVQYVVILYALRMRLLSSLTRQASPYSQPAAVS